MQSQFNEYPPLNLLSVPPMIPGHTLPSPGLYVAPMPEPALPMPSPRSYPSTPRSQINTSGGYDTGFGTPRNGHLPPQNMDQPVYGWRQEHQLGPQVWNPPYPHPQNYGPQVPPRVNQAPRPQPLGRTPSVRSTIASVTRPHSIASALVVSTGMGSIIAYGESVSPGSGTASEAVTPRGPTSQFVSSTSKNQRPDPNQCRLRGCHTRTAYMPNLGGSIEWCSVEHMSEGMHQAGSKPCRKCKANPRRWDDEYCCNKCRDGY